MDVGRAEKRMSLGRSGGFTLVELLVVIAIIAVLAAIAFPVFVKAKETAKISECLSNLREIGAGLHMYLDENNSRFPTAVPWGRPTYWSARGSQKTIQELLSPYVRSGMVADSGGMYVKPGVFACPSDIGVPQEFDMLNGVPANRTIWRYTGCSYEYYASNQEDWLRWAVDPPKRPWTALSPEVQTISSRQRIGAPLVAITSTSKKAVLGDTWYWHMGDQVPVQRLAYRNTLFADGHAQRVRGMVHLEARQVELRPWHQFTEIDDE